MRTMWRVSILLLGASVLLLSVSCSSVGRPYQSGRLYFSQKMYDRAAQEFEKAVAEDPDNGKYHFELAKAYAELGRNSEAAVEFSIAREKAPELAEEVSNALLHYMAGYYNPALELMKEGHYEEAISRFRQVLALDDSHVPSYVNMGFCQLELGKRKEAASSAKKAVDLAPDNEDARELITKVFPVKYDVALVQFERPSRAGELFGEGTITKRPAGELTEYIYEDGLVRIAWTVLECQLQFTIENKADHSMKVPWDEAAYVDTGGQTHRVIHSGVKYVDRDRPQPASVVVRQGRLADVVSPADYIYTVEGEAGWKHEPLFPVEGYTDHRREEEGNVYVGKTIQILLPLAVQDDVYEYIFQFEVQDAWIER